MQLISDTKLILEAIQKIAEETVLDPHTDPETLTKAVQ
jgi:hypothetical protein